MYSGPARRTMAKVKLLVSRAGTGFEQEAGQVIDVSNDEATRMIATGQAEPVEGARETAALSGGKRGGRKTRKRVTEPKQ